MARAVGDIAGEESDAAPAGAALPVATDRIEAINGNKHVKHRIRRPAAGTKVACRCAEDVPTAGAKLEQETVIAVHAKPIKTRLQLQEGLDVHCVPIRGFMDDGAETWFPWNVIIAWEMPIRATAVVNYVRVKDVRSFIRSNRCQVSLVRIRQARRRIEEVVSQLIFHFAVPIGIAARITPPRDRELMNAHLKPRRGGRRIDMSRRITGRNQGVNADSEAVRLLNSDAARILEANINPVS